MYAIIVGDVREICAFISHDPGNPRTPKEKYSAVLLQEDNENSRSGINIVVNCNNTPIPWSQTTKYLCIALDRRLNWNFKRGKTRLVLTKTQLLSRRSLLLPKNKMRLYKMVLRTAMTYAVLGG